MKTDRLGLTELAYLAPNGTLVRIPHRLPAHGLMMFAPTDDVALLVLPVCAVDDPQFGSWLAQHGVYRIEDPELGLARIGEGQVLDRVRWHRASPSLRPLRLSCGFGLSAEWDAKVRQYLEEAMANHWLANGYRLASPRFRRRHWLAPALRRRLDQLANVLWQLEQLADRILDDDADELLPVAEGVAQRWPAPPNVSHDESTEEAAEAEVVPLVHWQVKVFRRYPPGCTLRYHDGRIAAFAQVGRNDIVLRPGSSVRLTVSPPTNSSFAHRHQEFLKAAKVKARGEIGITGRAIAAHSAAFLLRMITGNRCHNADRWQVIVDPPAKY